MKKLYFIPLVLLLALSLTACGGNGGASPKTAEPLTEEEAAAIAEPYFRENYGMEVEATDVRLGLHRGQALGERHHRLQRDGGVQAAAWPEAETALRQRGGPSGSADAEGSVPRRAAGGLRADTL